MATPQKSQPKYGKPEEKNITKTLLMWAFIICGVGGIALMVALNPKQRKLSCDSTGGAASFVGFGTCHED